MKAPIIYGGLRSAKVARRTLEGKGDIRRASINGHKVYCKLKANCSHVWEVIKTMPKNKK